jgi:uncharacterized membrane protein
MHLETILLIVWFLIGLTSVVTLIKFDEGEILVKDVIFWIPVFSCLGVIAALIALLYIIDHYSWEEIKDKFPIFNRIHKFWNMRVW